MVEGLIRRIHNGGSSESFVCLGLTPQLKGLHNRLPLMFQTWNSALNTWKLNHFQPQNIKHSNPTPKSPNSLEKIGMKCSAYAPSMRCLRSAIHLCRGASSEECLSHSWVKSPQESPPQLVLQQAVGNWETRKVLTHRRRSIPLRTSHRNWLEPQRVARVRPKRCGVLLLGVFREEPQNK